MVCRPHPRLAEHRPTWSPGKRARLALSYAPLALSCARLEWIRPLDFRREERARIARGARAAGRGAAALAGVGVGVGSRGRDVPGPRASSAWRDPALGRLGLAGAR